MINFVGLYHRPGRHIRNNNIIAINNVLKISRFAVSIQTKVSVPLNRSKEAIKSHLQLLLCSPTNKLIFSTESTDFYDKNLNITAYQILKDLKELKDPILTTSVIERLCDVKMMSQKELTMAIQCFDSCNKKDEALRLYLEASKIIDKNIVGEIPLIALLKTIRYSDNHIEQGIVIYKEAINNNKQYPGLFSSPIILNCMINLYASSSKCNINTYGEMNKIFEDFKSQSLIPHISTYGLMISLSAKCGCTYETADKLYKEYLGHQYETTSFIETALVVSAAKNRNFSLCFEIYNRIINQKLAINSYLVSRMINVCIKSNKLEAGLNVIVEWRKQGGVIDWFLCRAILKLIGCIDNHIIYQNSKELNIQLVEADKNKNLSTLEYRKNDLLKSLTNLVIKYIDNDNLNVIPVPNDIILALLPNIAMIGQLDKVFHYFAPKNNNTFSIETIDALTNVFLTLSRNKKWKISLSLLERLKAYLHTFPSRDNMIFTSYCVVSLINSKQLDRCAWPLLQSINNNYYDSNNYEIFFEILCSNTSKDKIPIVCNSLSKLVNRIDFTVINDSNFILSLLIYCDEDINILLSSLKCFCFVNNNNNSDNKKDIKIELKDNHCNIIIKLVQSLKHKSDGDVELDNKINELSQIVRDNFNVSPEMKHNFI